jgi:hypothetical protein
LSDAVERIRKALDEQTPDGLLWKMQNPQPPPRQSSKCRRLAAPVGFGWSRPECDYVQGHSGPCRSWNDPSFSLGYSPGSMTAPLRPAVWGTVRRR